MPLVIPALQAILLANFGGNAILGISSPQLATAIATGFVTYAQSALLATSVDVGTLGAGTGTALTIILPAPTMVGPLIGTLAAAGVNGEMKIPLANAIANAISIALAGAQALLVNTGVGVGTGKLTLVPNPGASVPLMVTAFAGSALIGVSAAGMAAAVAQGIDAGLPSATGIVVIAGPPSIVPGAGVGTGKVL